MTTWSPSGSGARRLRPERYPSRITEANSYQLAASITVAELVFCALLLGERGRTLLDRIERDLLQGLTVLPFDEAAARRFAASKADLYRRGAPIGDADLQIASIALMHGLTIVTANTRHLAGVAGVAVDNWLA